MGRAFETELSMLDNTFNYSIDVDTHEIEGFLRKIQTTPVLIIGSGGSFSAAKTFEYFISRTTMSSFAKAVTPLELRNHSATIRNCAAALLTAGGNNLDTVNAFKFLIELEAKALLAVCIRDKSKIHDLVSKYPYVDFLGKGLPSGKDGFLAVNSLLSTVIMLAKAFNRIFPECSFFEIDKASFQNAICFSESMCTDELLHIMNCHYFILLHGGMSTSAAYDLESKFTEAALGSVQLADYRNFAHGRHNWISKYKTDTCVIALSGPNEEVIAQKTLACLPKDIPTITLKATQDNVSGLIELFIQVFYLTFFAGCVKNVDPGKPSIQEFGKKLYHISYSPWLQSKSNPYSTLSKRAAYRKCGMSSNLFDGYEHAFQQFSKRICNQKFSGIVFDYDGTLKDKTDKDIPQIVVEKLIYLLECGIKLGIATGRGKSVRFELSKIVPSHYWSNIIIAYYNGGEIASMDNTTIPNLLLPPCQDLQTIKDELESILSETIHCDLRPSQLTLFFERNDQQEYSNNVLYEICARYPNVKINKSGHSVDITPISSSKLKIMQYFSTGNVISIGDSGSIEGNDFALLSHPYGLSVNHVSTSYQTCWNCAPLGLRGTRATEYYLSSISIESSGVFGIQLNN